MQSHRTRPPASGPKAQAAADEARSKLLLVDFENVQPTDFAGLGDDYGVIIFVGTNQKNVPLSLVTSAQQMGPRVEWQRVAGEGRNALDFFIACHLGRVLERAPGTDCIVLSRDKGFDPLLRQLNESGLRCRRIASRSELAAKSLPRPAARQSAQPADPRYQRALAVLRNLEKRSRPRNRKRLAQVISAIFQREIAQKEVNRIVDALLAAGLITEADNTISYTL